MGTGEADILERLFAVILERRERRPPDSYVVRLLDGGLPAIAAKIREEGEEVIAAASGADREHTAREVADLVFHTWVLLAACDVSPSRVFAALEQRFGTSGLVEKASRGPRDAE